MAQTKEQLEAKKAAYRASPRGKAVAKAYNESVRDKKRLYARRKRGVVGAHGEAYSGPCPICPFVGPLVLDHVHSTGAIRGWLCRACNGQLGWLETNEKRIQAYRDAHKRDPQPGLPGEDGAVHSATDPVPEDS